MIHIHEVGGSSPPLPIEVRDEGRPDINRDIVHGDGRLIINDSHRGGMPPTSFGRRVHEVGGFPILVGIPITFLK